MDDKIDGKKEDLNIFDNHGVVVKENKGIINNYNNGSIHVSSVFPFIISTLGERKYSVNPSRYKNLDDYTVQGKISHNSVIKYKELIENYSIYYGMCEDFLNSYDNTITHGKAKVLDQVSDWYSEEKGELLVREKATGKSSLEIVQDYADDIIDNVKKRITDVIYNSPDVVNYSRENLEMGLTCFTCYCFMECKILEKP